MLRNETRAHKDFHYHTKKLLSVPFRLHTILTDSDLLWTPRTLNCVSAVRKVLFDTVRFEIPKTWIGNIPKELVTYEWFSLLDIPYSDVRNGDLLFVWKYTDTSITHLMLALPEWKVFHSCRARNTTIDDLQYCLQTQYRPLTSDLLRDFVDPRTPYEPQEILSLTI